MVKVEIVEEKEDSIYQSSEASSSTTSLSSVSSEIEADESLLDRIVALRDIVPPETRHKISVRVSKTASAVKTGSRWIGKTVWIITTSALLVALPLIMSLEDEAKILDQEKEMLEQQAGTQQMMAPMYPPQSKPLVPPGF